MIGAQCKDAPSLRKCHSGGVGIGHRWLCGSQGTLARLCCWWRGVRTQVSGGKIEEREERPQGSSELSWFSLTLKSASAAPISTENTLQESRYRFPFCSMGPSLVSVFALQTLPPSPPTRLWGLIPCPLIPQVPSQGPAWHTKGPLTCALLAPD